MESIRPLATVCKQLRQETRDDTVTRLQKQKHAAHTRIYRLNRKMKEMELANRLLAAVWLATKHQNEAIQAHVLRFVEEVRALEDA